LDQEPAQARRKHHARKPGIDVDAQAAVTAAAVPATSVAASSIEASNGITWA
jgi:hypothetical protein